MPLLIRNSPSKAEYSFDLDCQSNVSWEELVSKAAPGTRQFTSDFKIGLKIDRPLMRGDRQTRLVLLRLKRPPVLAEDANSLIRRRILFPASIYHLLWLMDQEPDLYEKLGYGNGGFGFGMFAPDPVTDVRGEKAACCLWCPRESQFRRVKVLPYNYAFGPNTFFAYTTKLWQIP